jgi:hypothetical protein
VSRPPRRPSDDELKFPNPFEEERKAESRRVRDSLPLLPSVGLGPEEPEEAQNPEWDPLKSPSDDPNLPDKPLTWRRRLMWPAIAVLCGLLLVAVAFALIEQSGDGGSENPRPTAFPTAGAPLAAPFASATR